ncbi:MAG: hypothetical protein ABEJ05_00230, partial [Haloglomus sp.]
GEARTRDTDGEARTRDTDSQARVRGGQARARGDQARTRRGQAHALEGVIGSLLILSAVVMALQVSVVTPLASSAASQHVGNQLQGTTQGLVASAQSRGQLRPTLLYWNASGGGFHNTGALGVYVSGGPPTAFGRRLNATFGNDVAFNVVLHYLDPDGDRQTRLLVRSGTPAENAVAVTRTVTLYDGDNVLAADGTRTGTTLADANTYFAPDVAPGQPTYNVVEVEVVAWQM